VTDLRTAPTYDGDPFAQRVREYSYLRPLQRIHVLEAGCGWGRGLELGDLERHVTGVDLDEPALRAHTLTRSDLDCWHLGDLRTVPLPPREYDVVHAPFLIERIPQAELVLDRFVAALKPGGLLLVRLRDRATAFGFIDRMLPSWLRTRIGDAVGGMTGAAPTGSPDGAGGGAAGGAPGGAAGGAAEGAPGGPAGDLPPTPVYEPVASRKGMRWYCVMRGLVVAEEYVSTDTVAAFGRWTGLIGWLGRMVATLSGNRLTADHSEVTLVIRKPENRFARVI
jgi:SAM-dependent methyltransferase